MTDSLDLVWGATSIADALDLPGPNGRRKVFRLLETGAIPARKIGGSWVASRAKLRQHVIGDHAAEGGDTVKATSESAR